MTSQAGPTNQDSVFSSNASSGLVPSESNTPESQVSGANNSPSSLNRRLGEPMLSSSGHGPAGSGGRGRRTGSTSLLEVRRREVAMAMAIDAPFRNDYVLFFHLSRLLFVRTLVIAVLCYPFASASVSYLFVYHLCRMKWSVFAMKRQLSLHMLLDASKSSVCTNLQLQQKSRNVLSVR